MSGPDPIAESGAADDLLAGLADEFLRRYRAGEQPGIDEYATKHPELADRIRELFPAMMAMEQPQAGATLDAAPVAERVGTTIGRYKLLERIGEGGFGVVYMAEQQHPVRRKVALKLIKPGMDSRQVLARFEAERQALAIMDHPNIARVLDAGATETGRPYFVMELVKGAPITDYCDNNQLSPRQRLELFVQVCHAVQHAHQKGIIHRDLKPTNVLVAVHDTTPVVKVIDFGVAKALGQELTEKTLFTGFAQLLGTPLYMSPEQAGQSSLDIDTRSDIYSLGVLLYELLTGTTPVDKERFRQAAQEEIRRIIREEEPPRPSTRLSESKATLASISAQRDTQPAKLTKLVRGELDWIVMKALEKDRGRRYETANGFARDIQRYLADEPVEASPPSAGYKLRKFARKHRKILATAGAFLILLAAAATVSTWQAVRATRALAAERQARADETKARQQAFAALRSMTKSIDMGLVNKKFYDAVVLTEDDRAFLRDVIAQYDAFAAIKADDAESRALRGEGRIAVGGMHYEIGRFKEAEQDFDQALSIYKQLAAEFPARPEFRAGQGSVHFNRGYWLQSRARLKEAEQDFDQALNIYKQLAADFPSRSDFRDQLAQSHLERGGVLRITGRPEAAQQEDDEAQSIRKQLAADFPSRSDFREALGYSYTNRGEMLRYAGRLKEAEQDYDQALTIFEHLAADFPEYRSLPAWIHEDRGIVLRDLGRFTEAEQDFNQALSTYKQLAADFPNRPRLQQHLAAAGVDRASLYRVQGNWAAAKRLLLESQPHHLLALEDNPGNQMYRRSYYQNLRELTIVHAGLLEQQDAVRTAEICRDMGVDLQSGGYNAACALSQCVPIVAEHPKLNDQQRKEAVQFYGDAAMRLLREAVTNGYKGAEFMKKDTDFEPLRRREDFQKLIAELAKGK